MEDFETSPVETASDLSDLITEGNTPPEYDKSVIKTPTSSCRYKNIINKLDNNEKLKLLFVSPDYKGTYPYSDVETSYFNKDKFECHVKFITNKEIPEIIELSKQYDCIINLCDGYLDNINDTPAVNFIEALENAGVPYTGSCSRVYKMSKADLRGKISTPNSVLLEEYLNNNDIINDLQFPLFIKPNNLGCSEHIDDTSVVYNNEELDNKLKWIQQYTTDVLIQEYINGGEYTAMLLRDKNGQVICLGPIQLKFATGAKYLTYDTKVNNFDDIIYEFDIKEEISEKIKKVCIEAYEKLEINSYVRMDLRDNYIVDINSYPELLGLVEEENIGDTIVKKYYSFDNFLTDILYDAARFHGF